MSDHSDTHLEKEPSCSTEESSTLGRPSSNEVKESAEEESRNAKREENDESLIFKELSDEIVNEDSGDSQQVCPDVEGAGNHDNTDSTRRVASYYVSYPIRWFMLFLYCFYTIGNLFQWVQLSIITNIIMRYYDVSAGTVDWLSMIYFIFYIPIIMPASWYLEAKGLRRCMLLGTFSNMVGALIKCAAIDPDLFWVLCLGQVFVSISAVYVLSIPPYLAAVWFSSEQVSSASGIGVFATMFGMLLGFVLPGVMVEDSEDEDVMQAGLRLLYYFTAALCSVSFILMALFFKERPPTPPSAAAEGVLNSIRERTNYRESLARLLKNVPFLMHLNSYCANLLVLNVLTTFLNQIYLAYFPGETEYAGDIGLLMMAVGIVFLFSGGVILDRTAKFKCMVCTSAALGLTFMVLFTITLELEMRGLVFFVGGMLGGFICASYSIGLEMAAELTFPECEGTTAGLLMAYASALTVAFILVGDKLFELYGARSVNLLFCALMLIAFIFALLTKEDLRRQRMKTFELKESSNLTTTNEDVKGPTPVNTYGLNDSS